MIRIAAATLLLGCAPGAEAPAPVTERLKPATACEQCHPQQAAEWRQSMHAHAALSPVVRRMVALAEEETVSFAGKDCWSCHAPAAAIVGELVPGAPAGFSPVSNDGVTCDMCHALAHAPEPASRDLASRLGDPGVVYGNLANPAATPGHGAAERTFFAGSSLCSACHQFSVERELEDTFAEWQQTGLAASALECPTCHMPEYAGAAALGTPGRPVLHRHGFVGTDYALEPRDGVDVSAQKEGIRSLLRLALKVAVLGMPSSVAAGSAFDFGVALTNNRSGHSIPSGVPFLREMWILVEVTDAAGATVYRSGGLGPKGDLAPDPALASFGARLLDFSGDPTWFTWRAATLDKSPCLAFGETRTSPYTVAVPAGTAGPLGVRVTVRYRPLPPGLLRALGLEALPPIEVFDLWSDEWTVDIQGG